MQPYIDRYIKIENIHFYITRIYFNFYLLPGTKDYRIIYDSGFKFMK